MTWATDFHFKVDPKPEADKFMPKGGWGVASPPVSPWTVGSAAASVPVVQAYQIDENLKKSFGIELAVPSPSSISKYFIFSFLYASARRKSPKSLFIVLPTS